MKYRTNCTFPLNRRISKNYKFHHEKAKWKADAKSHEKGG